uniref:Uncharacterized protein n=1 Tax=Tanacetum cinerariifolium TaxID=118510 RepID=A0A699IXF1_TANCI|nr:hypothetical protein [Tanacetum cinerariifolium]
MTSSTIKRLTKPLGEPEIEFQRLRKVAMRSHQNESLAIARRNLFDDEASASNNTGAKLTTPPKTLHEHSRPNSFGFQNPITFPTKQTGRIVDSRDIWLIQSTCTFQGLKNEDPLCHDNILADGVTRDTSRGRLKRSCNQISFLETPTREVGLKNLYLICDYCGGSHEADECKQNNPSEQVCISERDIYNDHSLLRFYHNDDTSPWGNNKRKKRERMPLDGSLEGAKVLKDLLSHKEKLKKAASSVKLSEECSAIIQRILP